MFSFSETTSYLERKYATSGSRGVPLGCMILRLMASFVSLATAAKKCMVSLFPITIGVLLG